MMAAGHTMSGLAAGLATAPVFTDNVLAGGAYVGLVTVSSLLPDIDHPRSTISGSLGPITRAFSHLLGLFTKHRGLTHRDSGIVLWTCLLAGLCTYAGLPIWVALASGVGCVVHVLGDAITEMGVRPFQFFPKYRLALTKMNAGGPVERWLVIPLLALASVWFAWSLVF